MVWSSTSAAVVIPFGLGGLCPVYITFFSLLTQPQRDHWQWNGVIRQFTSQPASDQPNGFPALAQFDKPENGGNGDGVIDEHDSVYQQLILWIDENHDGVSQPNELHTLRELGVYSITLSYVESGRQDDFGNQFRYKAQIIQATKDRRDQTPSGEPGRWADDVFLVTQ
jgi:hypothetical protein